MKNKIFVGEFIGSALLVMAIVGSGIMAESLTNDAAVMLLANAVATGAALYFLIVLSAINNDEALLFTKQTPSEPSSKFIA